MLLQREAEERQKEGTKQRGIGKEGCAESPSAAFVFLLISLSLTLILLLSLCPPFATCSTFDVSV